jgi:superfamily II DNA or RNA helicase
MLLSIKWSEPDARIVSHRGYAIRKDQLSKEQTQQLRKALTVQAKVAPAFKGTVSPFPIFYESPTRWYVPRFWGIEHCGNPDGDARLPGLPLRSELHFAKELRAEQLPIVAAFQEGDYNGLLCVPCGYGKTFMAIWLACALRKRFLVVVHQEFLMEQWRTELASAIPGIRIGKLQGPKAQLGPEYDCCICMLQTVCTRDWSVDQFQNFGFTIFDECHHLGAEHFSRALMSIQTKHMLGLSATPDRQDGLDNVFLWFLGPVRYQIRIREPDASVEVRILSFTSADPAYLDTPTNFRGEVCRPKLCTQLASFMPRTLAICDVLAPVLHEGRKLLILSDRRDHLQAFEEEFRKRGFTSMGYYVGGMKTKDRDISATQQIVLGTFTLAAEGMNIRDLNTIALVTPKSRIEQAIGRIFRLKKEERTFQPLIFDVQDAHEVCQNQFRKRCVFYKQCAYTLKNTKGELLHVKSSQKKEDVIPNVPLFRS